MKPRRERKTPRYKQATPSRAVSSSFLSLEAAFLSCSHTHRIKLFFTGWPGTCNDPPTCASRVPSRIKHFEFPLVARNFLLVPPSTGCLSICKSISLLDDRVLTITTQLASPTPTPYGAQQVCRMTVWICKAPALHRGFSVDKGGLFKRFYCTNLIGYITCSLLL